MLGVANRPATLKYQIKRIDQIRPRQIYFAIYLGSKTREPFGFLIKTGARINRNPSRLHVVKIYPKPLKITPEEYDFGPGNISDVVKGQVISLRDFGVVPYEDGSWNDSNVLMATNAKSILGAKKALRHRMLITKAIWLSRLKK